MVFMISYVYIQGHTVVPVIIHNPLLCTGRYKCDVCGDTEDCCGQCPFKGVRIYAVCSQKCRERQIYSYNNEGDVVRDTDNNIVMKTGRQVPETKLYLAKVHKIYPSVKYNVTKKKKKDSVSSITTSSSTSLSSLSSTTNTSATAAREIKDKPVSGKGKAKRSKVIPEPRSKGGFFTGALVAPKVDFDAMDVLIIYVIRYYYIQYTYNESNGRGACVYA